MERSALFAGLGLFSAISHILSIVAFRLSDASGTLIGYFAFDEVPGTPTVVGTGFIIAAGLILLQRQNRQGDQAN